jgi:hypothetical protein
MNGRESHDFSRGRDVKPTARSAPQDRVVVVCDDYISTPMSPEQTEEWIAAAKHCGLDHHVEPHTGQASGSRHR